MRCSRSGLASSCRRHRILPMDLIFSHGHCPFLLWSMFHETVDILLHTLATLETLATWCKKKPPCYLSAEVFNLTSGCSDVHGTSLSKLNRPISDLSFVFYLLSKNATLVRVISAHHKISEERFRSSMAFMTFLANQIWK
jgi:hypothetical protein